MDCVPGKFKYKTPAQRDYIQVEQIRQVPNKINTVKKEKVLWEFKGDRTYMWLAEDGLWKECIEDTGSKIGPVQWIGYKEATPAGEGHSTQRQRHEKWRHNAGKQQILHKMLVTRASLAVLGKHRQKGRLQDLECEGEICIFNSVGNEKYLRILKYRNMIGTAQKETVFGSSV